VEKGLIALGGQRLGASDPLDGRQSCEHSKRSLRFTPFRGVQFMTHYFANRSSQQLERAVAASGGGRHRAGQGCLANVLGDAHAGVSCLGFEQPPEVRSEAHGRDLHRLSATFKALVVSLKRHTYRASHVTIVMPATESVHASDTPIAGALEVLELAPEILADLDLEEVLKRVLEAARKISGATYAALGVLDESRTELQRFLTVGVNEEARRGIGEPPTGRGVLGELIENPLPLRLANVGEHSRSYGFPPGHPRMETFLGVPVMVGSRPFGNLYLTEKRDGRQFTVADEQAVVLLARFAGVAIDHARRYSGLDARHTELRHTSDALDASLQITRALGGQTDLDAILTLVAKRGRALVSARALVIEHEQDGKMMIAAGAGDVPAGLIGACVDVEGSLAGAALRRRTTLRLEDEANMARFERHGLGRLGVRASAGLVIPLVFRGQTHGVLVAVDRLTGGPSFTGDDQRLLEAFAASAATAVATAESVRAERRRQRLAAAEQERARWARELHDETLQSLAAVRVGLAAQLRDADPGPMTEAVGEAVAQLALEIGNLRSLITDLRPAALDDLGVEEAIRDLAERAGSRGLEVDLSIDLGFDPIAKTSGFGLIGMHERAELVGGALEIDTGPEEGTTVRAVLPARRRHARIA
jgi:signal transduction histidine kinase